ncbi:MAG: hypothetical protein RBR45_12295 [Pseudomonas sp.]|jgi:hypothetical protein|nr:hypothetical protein [Pseudomonas sp.]
MKIHIIGHEDHLGTMELDYPQEQVQRLIIIRINRDRSSDGIPLLDLTGKPPKSYITLEYALADYKQGNGKPMYQFHQVLDES